MGKKFLEVRVNGRKRKLDANDVKIIYYYSKKQTPPLPRMAEEEDENEYQCGSPTET